MSTKLEGEWYGILREAEEMAKEENGAEIAAEFRDWIEELKIELEVDDDPEHLVDFINKIGR